MSSAAIDTKSATDSAATVRSEPVTPDSLARVFVRGGMSLGAAYSIERGTTFLAGLLAARIAGASAFGAYALALSTASMVASYSGAGIGSTSNRFSGQFQRSSPGYRGFVRALALISLASASLATLLLLAGSGPLAAVLLHNSGLAGLLRGAAFMGGAVVLAECCKGFLIGQRRVGALILWSIVSGAGLLVVLPLTARINPAAMITGQTAVLTGAVAAVILFRRRLGLSPIRADSNAVAGPAIKPVLMFGLVQLSGVAGINIASWWIAALVASSDPALHQMGYYSAANQLRALACIAPGLLAQATYPLLSRESGDAYGGPDRVMAQGAIVSTIMATCAALAIVLVLPWAVAAMYGASFISSEPVAGLLLGAAVIHMGGIPAANRLSIVSPRALALVNGLWALLLCGLGSLFAVRWGALGASAAFLIAHACSQCFVMFCLKSRGALPRLLLLSFFGGLLAAMMIAGLAMARVWNVGISPGAACFTTAGCLTIVAILFRGLKAGAVNKPGAANTADE